MRKRALIFNSMTWASGAPHTHARNDFHLRLTHWCFLRARSAASVERGRVCLETALQMCESITFSFCAGV